MPISVTGGPLFEAHDAPFVIVELGLDVDKPGQDFIKAPVEFCPEVVKLFVLTPGGQPDRNGQRRHNRQRNTHEHL